MDKKEVKKIVASIIVTVLIIGVGVFAAIYLMNSSNAAIQLSSNSAAYQDFVKALIFDRSSTGDKKWFMFGVTAIIYLGVILFIAGLICVFAKRSIRFVNLPIFGLCAFVVGGFALSCFYQVFAGTTSLSTEAIVLLIITIALVVLGIIAFVFSLAFPYRLIAKAEDEPLPSPKEAKPEPEVAPAKEESPEEKAEEPAPVVEETMEEKAEEPTTEEKAEEVPAEEPVSEEKEEEPALEAEPEPEPEQPSPEVEQRKPAAKRAPAKKAAPVPPLAPAPAPVEKKAVGKYEVFPEAGFFKYRLKANNGEILIVSNPYRTKESAIAGIDTLKKNVPLGNHKVIVDKNKFGQFRIFTGNDSRLVVAGEIYPNATGAEKALASVLKFYDTDRMVLLDEIPESEHREWHLDMDKKADPLQNGKIIIVANEDGKFQASLSANNGELLFTTATYSGKAGLKKAMDNISEKLLAGENLTIAKDKQNRYQFRLYSDNGMLLLMGETYPSYESASKAASSARNFIGGAKVIE